MDERTFVPAEFPGAEIVSQGLADLAAGRESANADAVAMASARLRSAGIEVPAESQSRWASHRLYERLAREDPRNAHARYNAVVRRVVSFARAAEHARAAGAERAQAADAERARSG